jgi:hypothetical protein
MNMKWNGVTPDQYEKLRKVVNWEGNNPKGSVFHVASFSKKGIRVTDIWESEADLNNFVQKRLMPGVKEVGIQGEPQIKVFPLHAIFVPDAEKLEMKLV